MPFRKGFSQAFGSPVILSPTPTTRTKGILPSCWITTDYHQKWLRPDPREFPIYRDYLELMYKVDYFAERAKAVTLA